MKKILKNLLIRRERSSVFLNGYDNPPDRQKKRRPGDCKKITSGVDIGKKSVHVLVQFHFC